MEVGTGADGIQRLLAAETEAQAIVSKARKGKKRGESEGAVTERGKKGREGREMGTNVVNDAISTFFSLRPRPEKKKTLTPLLHSQG